MGSGGLGSWLYWTQLILWDLEIGENLKKCFYNKSRKTVLKKETPFLSSMPVSCKTGLSEINNDHRSTQAHANFFCREDICGRLTLTNPRSESCMGA
jgi:hypothetical protein